MYVCMYVKRGGAGYCTYINTAHGFFSPNRREFSGHATLDQYSIHAKSPPVSFYPRPPSPAQRVLLQSWHSLWHRLLLKALRSYF